MKMIDHIIDELHEEIDGAKEYAEKYIENTARGNSTRANRYKEMAMDELKHAGYLRDFAIADIGDVQRVYAMTEEEHDKWQRCHKWLAEQMAMVKHMLAM